MQRRENFLAMLKKKPYKRVPVEFGLCPFLENEYRKHTGSDKSYPDYFDFPWRNIPYPEPLNRGVDFTGYYPQGLAPDTEINMWGVAHEPGPASAYHMKRMRHPLMGNIDVEEIAAYPFPVFDESNFAEQKSSAEDLRSRDYISLAFLQMTIWETAWAIRGMEDLMADMMGDEPTAEILLNKVTETAVSTAKIYAKAGADVLYLGDDIGMQHSTMMSESLYTSRLLPLLKTVIDAARQVNPEIIVFYHSCGKINPFIPHLIKAGVDVLNPIQPECMSFKEIYGIYHRELSFCGTLGTQSIMPKGTPDEVRRTVFENLDIADGGKGLFITPTHLLEPDVPWANIEAYVKACQDYF